MTPELLRFLEAQGIRFDEEGRPTYYDAFEGTTRRVGQEELDRFTQNYEQVTSAKDSQGRPRYGTDVYTGLNSKFGNTPTYDPVTIDGVEWMRGNTYEGDTSQPEWKQVYDQYGVTPNDFMYDPTYGALMKSDAVARTAMPLADAINGPDGGFFGAKGPFQAFSKTIGAAMGLSSLAAAGLGAAAGGAGASYLPTGAGEWAANALANAGGTGIPYQSLASSLAQHAGANGGSWADITGAFTSGTGGPMQLPSSYWDMLAEGGGTMSDASPAAAGAVEGSSLTNFNQFLNPEYIQSVPGVSGGVFNGDLASLRSLIDPSVNFVQSIPGISTAAGAAAFPAISQSAATLGAPGLLDKAISNAPGLLGKLFTPNNLLTAGTSLLGSGLNAYAANKASGAQIDSTDKATAAALAMYDQNRADLAPWRNAGSEAVGRLSEMLKPGYKFEATDPGYNFRMNEGQKLIERSRANSGNLFSGGTGKALTRYGQEFGANEFTNATNRLANLAGLGQSATNTTVGAGQNTAAQVGQNTIGAGNARASGYVAGSNAFTGGLTNILRGMQEQELIDALERYRR